MRGESIVIIILVKYFTLSTINLLGKGGSDKKRTSSAIISPAFYYQVYILLKTSKIKSILKNNYLLEVSSSSSQTISSVIFKLYKHLFIELVLVFINIALIFISKIIIFYFIKTTKEIVKQPSFKTFKNNKISNLFERNQSINW